MPVDTGAWSVQPLAGSWQVAQDTVESRERRFSKYRIFPNSTFASVNGLASGTGGFSKPAGTGYGYVDSSNCARAAGASMHNNAKVVAAAFMIFVLLF